MGEAAMSLLEEQAKDNAWARAHELGLPSILGRCIKAGMSWTEARAIVEECNGKREPHVFCTACISRWRAERC